MVRRQSTDTLSIRKTNELVVSLLLVVSSYKKTVKLMYIEHKLIVLRQCLDADMDVAAKKPAAQKTYIITTVSRCATNVSSYQVEF